MDNAKIATLLGWKQETRKINTWSYLGDRPFKMPMDTTVWIAPDGKEHYSLPQWVDNETVALSLVDTLTPEEKREWGNLYMGIGWLAQDGEPYSLTVCKAWAALKQKA